MFVKSLLFGTPGSYNFFNTVTVNFKVIPDKRSNLQRRIDALFYLFFVSANISHTLSHIVTCKLLTKKGGSITFYNGILQEYPRIKLDDAIKKEPLWKKTVVSFAGPSISMAVFNIQWIAACALKHYIGWPVATILLVHGVVMVAYQLLHIQSIDITGYEEKKYEDLPAKYSIPYRVALVAEQTLCLYLGIKFLGWRINVA